MSERPPLLDSVIAAARAADPLADPRWERLTEGTLPEAEAAALRAECESGRAPAGAYAALAPMDTARREHIAERAAAVAQREIRRPRGRWIGAAAGAVALAAAVVLWIASSSGPAEIPPYEAIVSTATARGDLPVVAPVVKLGPGQKLRVMLRPRTRVEGEIGVRAFARAGGRVMPWQPHVEVRSGVVDVTDVTADALPVSGSAVDLVFVIGRAGELAADAALVERIASGAEAGEGVRVVVVHVEPGAPGP